MPRFANLKILTKILVLLASLAVVSLAASVFTTWKMRYIDDTYGDIIDGPSAANLAIARANRDLIYIDRSIYRLLVETTDDGVKQAQKEIVDTEGFLNKQIKIAVRVMPAKRADIQAVADRYASAMSDSCAETRTLAASLTEASKKAAAAQMHAKCDPALNDLMLYISKLTNEIISISDQASEAALAVTNATIKLTYILILGGLTVVALIATYLTRSGISGPIKTIAAALEELVAGNYDTEILGTDRKDEVGGFARAALVFRDQGRETARLRAEQVAAQERSEVDKRAALVGMADRIETEAGAAVQQIGERTRAMTEIAKQMRAMAGRTGNAAQGASSATAIALTNAQTVASAAEELAASISEIGGQVNQSTAVVNRAVEASAVTRATIEALNERVSRISMMAKIIGDIAAKTNLLALNATIEAARAGDAGKGFAVVASEVKQLATQTARSTVEIDRQVGEVATATAEAAAAVGRIETTIGEVNVIARSIAAAMEQQGSATSEIARNVTETAAAVHEMSSRSDDVSHEAAQAGQYANEVLDNMTMLDGSVRDLRHAMIGIVRTSTAEVDRRMFQRYGVETSCRVELPGKGTLPARIIDISEGGAQLADLPDLASGTRGTLRIDGLAVALPFSVVSVNEQKQTVGLLFALEETERLALGDWIESTRRETAA